MVRMAPRPAGIGWRRLLVLAALLCLPMSALASRARAVLDLGSDAPVFLPGQDLTLSWNALPEGTAEFELLLVCESPVPIKLRLTTCLDPRLRTYRWRVPNLPCDVARLRIRAGVEGEELAWAWSAPFRIAWEARAPLPRVSLEGGELWLTEGRGQSDLASIEGSESADPSAFPGRGETLAPAPPSQGLGLPAASGTDFAEVRQREPSARPRAGSGSGRPLIIPLRI